MRICQADYLRYCAEPGYTPPTWPHDHWPDAVAPPSEAAWTEALGEFPSTLQFVKALVQDPEVNLAGEIPHADGQAYHGTRYADEIAAIADHNAYPLGPFATARRLLGTWPPDDLGEQDREDALGL